MDPRNGCLDFCRAASLDHHPGAVKPCFHFPQGKKDIDVEAEREKMKALVFFGFTGDPGDPGGH